MQASLAQRIRAQTARLIEQARAMQRGDYRRIDLLHTIAIDLEGIAHDAECQTMGDPALARERAA